MTCPSGYWQHTDVVSALACYHRMPGHMPAEDRPLGEGVTRSRFRRQKTRARV